MPIEILARAAAAAAARPPPQPQPPRRPPSTWTGTLSACTSYAAGAAASAARSASQAIASMSAAVRPSAATPPTDNRNGSRTTPAPAPRRGPGAASSGARSSAAQGSPRRPSRAASGAFTGLKGAVKTGATEVKGYAVEVLNQAMEARLVPMAVVLVLLLVSYMVGRLRRGKKKASGSNSSSSSSSNNSPRGLSVSGFGSTSAATAWSCAAAAASPRMYLARSGSRGAGSRNSAAAAAAAAGYLGGDRHCLGARDDERRVSRGLRFQTAAAGVEHSVADASARRNRNFGAEQVPGSGRFGDPCWEERPRRGMSLVVVADSKEGAKSAAAVPTPVPDKKCRASLLKVGNPLRCEKDQEATAAAVLTRSMDSQTFSTPARPSATNVIPPSPSTPAAGAAWGGWGVWSPRRSPGEVEGMFMIASRSAPAAHPVGNEGVTTTRKTADAAIAAAAAAAATARKEVEAAASAAAGRYEAASPIQLAFGREERRVPDVEAAVEAMGESGDPSAGQRATKGSRGDREVLVATATTGVEPAGIADELAAAMGTAMLTATAEKPDPAQAPPSFATKGVAATASVAGAQGCVRPCSPTMSDAAIQTEFCGMVATEGGVVSEGQAAGGGRQAATGGRSRDQAQQMHGNFNDENADGNKANKKKNKKKRSFSAFLRKMRRPKDATNEADNVARAGPAATSEEGTYQMLACLAGSMGSIVPQF